MPLLSHSTLLVPAKQITVDITIINKYCFIGCFSTLEEVMLFPNMLTKRFGYANIDDCAYNLHSWVIQTYKAPVQVGKNESEYLDPTVCSYMLDKVNKTLDVDATYGGWLEDRSIIWSGCYMAEEEKFTHLGVDFNVPAGSEVALSFNGTVVLLDDDTPEAHGWGPRVIVKLQAYPIYLIYAHLDPAVKENLKTGAFLHAGEIFAKVGASEHNGGWYPHLHVQALTLAILQEKSKETGWLRKRGGFSKVCQMVSGPAALCSFSVTKCPAVTAGHFLFKRMIVEFDISNSFGIVFQHLYYV